MSTKKILKRSLFYFLFSVSFLLLSCSKTKENKGIAKEENAKNPSFALTLSKTFYMTGNELDDLYIDAVVNSGEIKENSELEIVKKENPEQRITASVYRIDDVHFQQIGVGKSGQEVVLYLKVKNDKGFPLSNTGDLYTLVPKGQTVSTEVKTANGNAKILIDGQQWDYDYYKIYHYTKDYGVTRNPANYLITFTKTNKNLKNTPEELLQISLFHAPQEPKTFVKTNIDVAFNSDMFGNETAYSKPFSSDIAANASITTYTNNGNKVRVSGTFSSETKAFLCKTCPNIKIEITFTDLDVEVYNE